MVTIIAIALYGLKSSGSAWRTKIAETLISLGYKSYEEYADVWTKRELKPNRYLYYK